MIAKDHPELNKTPELDENGIKQQSLNSALQWLVALGRFDILIAVTTMSGYRIATREGHLERLKRIIGYVKKHPDGAIRFRKNIPDHESYHTPKNLIGVLLSMAISKRTCLMTCLSLKVELCVLQPINLNLFHDLVTGHSMTGILHMLNQTPIHWFSNQNAKVVSNLLPMVLSSWRPALLLNKSWIFATLFV
jgi:hypothetical protein